MSSLLFNQVFTRRKPIIAMLHVWDVPVTDQTRQAREDAARLCRSVDALLLENYGWGYQDPNLAYSSTGLALLSIAKIVSREVSIPIGFNILPNDYQQALQLADEFPRSFIQMDHCTGQFDNGARPVWPDDLQRWRSVYSKVAVLGGIHPKYYRLTHPVPLSISARIAADLVDAIVVTGEHTGGAARLADLEEVKRVCPSTPLIVGSGLTADNVREQLTIADGAIVGTAFKRRGVVPSEPIDASLVDRLMEEVAKLR